MPTSVAEFQERLQNVNRKALYRQAAVWQASGFGQLPMANAAIPLGMTGTAQAFANLSLPQARTAGPEKATETQLREDVSRLTEEI